jgi:hypothetical protein
MSDYVANFLPGQSVTFVAGGTIVGGNVLVHLRDRSRCDRRPVQGPATRPWAWRATTRSPVQPITVSRGGEQQPDRFRCHHRWCARQVGCGRHSLSAGSSLAPTRIDLILGTALITVADQAPVDVAWRA